MTKISKDKVEEIAKLARIHLSEDEKKQIEGELSSILDMVSELDKVDTKGVEAVDQITGLKNVYSDDEVKDCDIEGDELLKNVPETKDGYIKVKSVME